MSHVLILASTSVPSRTTMVQMPNLELVETKRITVYVWKLWRTRHLYFYYFCRTLGRWFMRLFAFYLVCYIFFGFLIPCRLLGVGCRGLVLIVGCIWNMSVVAVWCVGCRVSVVECLIWLSVVAVRGCSWFHDCQVSVVECLLWLSGVAVDGCSWFLVVGHWLSDFGVDFKGRLSLIFFIIGAHLCLVWLRQHWYYTTHSSSELQRKLNFNTQETLHSKS